MDQNLRRSRRTPRPTYKVAKKENGGPLPVEPPAAVAVSLAVPSSSRPRPAPGKMFVELEKGLLQSFGFKLGKAQEGFIVTGITPGEAAARTGGLHVGQRVYSLNGIQIEQWTNEQVNEHLSLIERKLILELDEQEIPGEVEEDVDSDESDEPEEFQFTNEELRMIMTMIRRDPLYERLVKSIDENFSRLEDNSLNSYNETLAMVKEVFRENRELKVKVQQLEEENRRLKMNQGRI